MIDELLKALADAKTFYFAFRTTQYGVPLVGDGDYMEQLSRGLDRLYEAGWELVCIADTTFVLRRRHRPQSRQGW